MYLTLRRGRGAFFLFGVQLAPDVLDPDGIGLPGGVIEFSARSLPEQNMLTANSHAEEQDPDMRTRAVLYSGYTA